MTPKEVIRQAEKTEFKGEDGKAWKIKLLPPLSKAEFQQLESRIPCPLPEEARELLSYCAGFEGGRLELVSFTDVEDEFLEEIFPHAVPIGHDGCGNYWIIDLTSDSKTWGPIFFACHDAPVVVFQTESLAHFLSELFKGPPSKCEIDDVYDDHQRTIWNQNPGMLTYEECLQSGDGDLVEFANSLGATFLFRDLRNPQIGDGFSWGRYNGQVNKRFGEKRIFAYEVRPSLWQRFWGK